MTKLLILEGPDCAGKTTLANSLKAYYTHATWSPTLNVYKHHMDILADCSYHESAVVDRLWLSELIYGNTFRNGPSYDVAAMMTYVNKMFEVKLIICLPPLNVVLEKFEEGKKTEMFNTVAKIWHAYNDVSGYETYDYTKDDKNDFCKYL